MEVLIILGAMVMLTLLLAIILIALGLLFGFLDSILALIFKR